MQPEIRPAHSKSEIEQALEVLYLAFPDTPPDYFQKHQWADLTLEVEHTQLALVDGEVRSVVQIFPRTMLVRGKELPLAGIGNVATHPEYQGQGLAGALLRRTLHTCRMENYALSLLFTGIPGFYETFGYRTVSGNEFLLTPVEEWPRGDIVPFSPKQHLGEVQQLYAEFTRDRTGTLKRDDSYWPGQLEFAQDDPGLFTLLVRYDRPVAYVRARAGAGLHIHEFAYRENVYDVFALASYLARERGLRRIQLPLTPAEVLQAPDPQPVEERDCIMIHLLAVEDIVEKFSLWDDEPESVIDTLFGAGEFTFWRTDYF